MLVLPFGMFLKEQTKLCMVSLLEDEREHSDQNFRSDHSLKDSVRAELSQHDTTSEELPSEDETDKPQSPSDYEQESKHFRGKGRVEHQVKGALQN